MRIEGTGRSGKVGSRNGASKTSGSGPAFKPTGGEATARAAASGSASPVAPIDAILALQAVEDPIFAKKKAIKRGESMLDVLEEMKADLLAGGVSEGRLNKLMALVQQAKMQSDPDLDALIADIELRALVELAKLGRYPTT